MTELKNLSGDAAPKGPKKALKFALIGFVALSIAGIVYRASAVRERAPAEPASAPDASPAPRTPPAAKKALKPAAGDRTALVYYFHTNTRCSSCKAIEAYTREAVATRLAAGYKGWKVEFKGVNVEEEANAHFVQDYWLNSKSVVVQKYSGDKPLKWAKLGKIWQLLGDKTAFIDYIAGETHKLLDEK